MLWLVGGAVGLAVIAVGWVVAGEKGSRMEQRSHVSRSLSFEGPIQPDGEGPLKVRFDCPDQSGPVMVKVSYIGVATEGGRPYANETNEIFLATTSAAGSVGRELEVPAGNFDRRARAFVQNGDVEAEVFVTGSDGAFGWRRADAIAMADVIAVNCEKRN